MGWMEQDLDCQLQFIIMISWLLYLDLTVHPVHQSQVLLHK
uniref:Uncharacterized protein LOC107612666 n=1 Tax=Rhizophora mucronata TaxID=61149 RepID=A0A2P2JVE4_RHIMU